MGLDFVELMMDTEERFQIVFPDDTPFQEVRTIGDYIDLTRQCIESYESNESCAAEIEQEIRQQVKETIMGLSNRLPVEIGDETNLKELLPPRKKRWRLWHRLPEQWKLTADQNGKEPRLKRIGCFPLLTMEILAILAMFIIPAQYALLQLAAVLLSITFFILGCFWNSLVYRWFFDFPGEIQTVGDLIRYLAATQTPRRKPDRTRWSDEEIETIIFELIAEIGNIKQGELTREVTFKQISFD